jgi:hypothetical protein
MRPALLAGLPWLVLLTVLYMVIAGRRARRAGPS